MASAESAPIRLAVAGAHLSGQPLNGDLVAAGARLVADTTTAAAYRLLALPVQPPRPALTRVDVGGAAVAVEVWELEPAGLGHFLTSVSAPMAIGRIELADASTVLGFTCDPAATGAAVDITAYGGWRAYLAAQSENAREPGPLTPAWLADLHSALDDRLGLRVLELTPARVVGQMPVAGNTQPFGLWHGGASCLLAETLASLGSLAHGRPERVPVGVDLNATHHRAVTDGWVTGTATALQLSRTMTSFDVTLTDDRGRRVCTARVTCRLVEPRSGSRQNEGDRG